MMCFTKPLPEYVEAEGRRYAIRTDFRIWIRFGEIAEEPLAAEDKVAELLSLCYKKQLPSDLSVALRLLFEFYCGGKTPKQKQNGQRERLYDFSEDAELFYAAYLAQYHIDLCRDSLHWWQFLALFHSLDDSCRLMRVIAYRGTELSEISDPKQKRFYGKMKALYRLPSSQNAQEADGRVAELLSEIM